MTTPKPWEAEVAVDAVLAQQLIESQFPELAPVQAVFLGVGWDNTVYRVNEQYVFRFPRKQMSVATLESERLLMPEVGHVVPVEVPVPIFLGKPSSRFPWIFNGYTFVSGRAAMLFDLNDQDRGRIGLSLAKILAKLHSIDAALAKQLKAPLDLFARLDEDRLHSKASANLEALKKNGLIATEKPWLDIIRSLADLPAPKAEYLVHADLYAAHMMLNDSRELTGIIDWGDVHLGDRACDLMLLYSFVPPAARPAFLKAYGGAHERTLRLARLRAIHHSAAVAVFAHDTGNRDLLREALWSLGNAIV